MATTSLWVIHERLDHVLEYASDTNKTIDTVLKYATDESKTESKEYVSCINCSSVNPFKSMMRTKGIHHTESKILGYHGYQSFKIGEGNPELVHQIGIETAKTLWGDRFEIVVATHLDKGHLHNHFVINSTSFVDGKMFHHAKKDIYRFREISDKLCLEHGLSIVENPQGKGKRRNEYHAVKSYIKEIKADIDGIIPKAFLWQEFINDMRFEGYEFDYINDELYIFHPNYSQPIAMKMLGHDYQFEQIKQRIINNYHPQRRTYSSDLSFDISIFYKKYKRNELKGFQYYYIKWQVAFGILPNKKVKQKLSKEVREACRYLKRITDETTLICKHNITNVDELNEYRDQVQKEYDEKIKLRKDCYYQRRIVENEDEKNMWSSKAKAYTPEIKKLHYTLKCLDEIEKRSKEFDKHTTKLLNERVKERDKSYEKN